MDLQLNDVQKLAEDAFIFAFPFVQTGLVVCRFVHPVQLLQPKILFTRLTRPLAIIPLNTLLKIDYQFDSDSPILSPNDDTLYSLAVVDLRNVLLFNGSSCSPNVRWNSKILQFSIH